MMNDDGSHLGSSSRVESEEGCGKRGSCRSWDLGISAGG